MKAQRILLLSEIFPPSHGGSGRWFSEIYSRFPLNSLVFAVGAHPEAAEYDQGFHKNIYRLNLSSLEWGMVSRQGAGFYFRKWRELARLAKGEGIDRIHCGRCLPEGFIGLLVKLSTGIGFSCYVHGEDVETALTSRELTMMTRWVLKASDVVICNSDNSSRILKEKWNMASDKIIVMHPGVDIQKFTPLDPGDRLPIATSGPTILTVGRLQRRKGQDMMIKSLPLLLEKYPELKYIIVGGGEEKENLVSLVNEFGLQQHVELVGEITDSEMVDLYRSSTLFALPNRRVGNDDEGFGMVLLEAQACGRPVVAGASGGTCETLMEGVTGRLADCTTPESLARVVDEMLADPEQMEVMGTAGRDFVEQNFGWDSLADRARKFFLNA